MRQLNFYIIIFIGFQDTLTNELILDRSLNEHPSLVSHCTNNLQGIDGFQDLHLAQGCLHQHENSSSTNTSTAVCCDWTFNALPQLLNSLHEPQEINFAAGNSCRREIQNTMRPIPKRACCWQLQALQRKQS
jgi:hypothetical protein